MISTKHDRLEAIHSITKNIPHLVTDNHNVSLLHSISLSKVQVVVMDMTPSNVPSLDGFTIDFFHHYWSTVKNGVWAFVSELQCISGFLPTLKAFFLMMIPREDKVVETNQLPPISLCNVIY